MYVTLQYVAAGIVFSSFLTESKEKKSPTVLESSGQSRYTLQPIKRELDFSGRMDWKFNLLLFIAQS